MKTTLNLTSEQIKSILNDGPLSLTKGQRDEIVESVAKTARKAKRWLAKYIASLKRNVNGHMEYGISQEDGPDVLAYELNRETGELIVFAPEFFDRFEDRIGHMADGIAVREFGGHFELIASTVKVERVEYKGRKAVEMEDEMEDEM